MQRRGENINSPHHPVEDSFSAQERGLWVTSSACFRTPGRWAIVCVCVCVCVWVRAWVLLVGGMTPRKIFPTGG